MGARPAATARSSIAGFMASMTTSMSFFISPCPPRSAPRRLAQDPQPGVLLALAPAVSEQQPRQGREDQDRQRREEDREPARDQRRALAVEREVARRLRVEPPPHAGEERRRRRQAERHTGESDD